MKTFKNLSKFLLIGTLYLCANLILFSSCSNSDDGNDNGETPSPTLSISPATSSISFSALATESYKYIVTTNQASWEVKTTPTKANWCKVQKTSDGKGFDVTAIENTSENSPEKVTITITAGNAKAISMTVSQEAKDLQAPNIYVAGYESKDACYWMNNEKVIFETEYLAQIKRMSFVGDDIYMVGSHNLAACYWKNGELIELVDVKNSRSSANSLSIINNNIYILGYERFFIENAYVNMACYWKNEEQVILSTSESKGYSSTVSGDDIYMVGYELDKSIMSYVACYWKNEEKFTLGTKYSEAKSIIHLDSDIYIVGFEINETGKMTACYWKNNVKTELSTRISQAYSITTEGTDIYILGYENIDVNKDICCYWKNGVKTIIESEGIYNVTNIYVNNEDVYISGYYSDGEKMIACYWKNGERIKLGIGSDESVGNYIIGINK